MVEIREVPEAKSEERFYRCSLPVTLRRRGADLHLITSDISFQGAFIRTEEAPPLNSLVRVCFTLPPDDTTLALSAHTVQVVKPGSTTNQYPGFGAHLVGMNGDIKARWESLVWSLKREHKQSVHTTVNFARPSYLSLVRQQQKTKVPEGATLRWLPESVEMLARIVREDIPSGTIFVAATGTTTPPGTKVCVELVHPITAEILALPGVIRRRGGVGAADGVLVALSPVSAELSLALTDMADSVCVVPDYDIDLFARPSLVPGPG